MRILVASDAHGAIRPIETAIEKSKPDYLIYLGDGVGRIKDIEPLYPNIKFYFVCGNCDFSLDGDIENEIVLGGKKIFFTHGHKYNVKLTYSDIIKEGIRRKADIVLFGHTHIAYNEYSDGMYILNPGSAGRAGDGRQSYGFIDIVDGSIFTNIVKL